MTPSTSEYAGTRNKEWIGGKQKDKRSVGATAGISCKRQIIDEIDNNPTTSKLSKYEGSKEMYKDISLSQAIKSSQNLQKSIAHNSHLKMFRQRRQFAGFLNKMDATANDTKRTKKKTPSDLSSSSSSSDSDEDDNMDFDDDNQDDSTSSGSCSSSSSGSDSSESSSDSSEFDEEDNYEENDDDDCDSDKSESKSNIFISQIPVKKEINVPAKNYTSPNTKSKDEHWGFAAVAKNRVDIFSQSRNMESDGFALKKCGNLLTGFNKNLVPDELNTRNKHINIKPLQNIDNEGDHIEKRSTKTAAKKDNFPETSIASAEAVANRSAKKPVEKLQKKKVATLKSAPLDTKRTTYKSDDDEVPYLNESTVIKYQMMENTNYSRGVKPFAIEESSSNEKVEYDEVYPENPFGKHYI